MSQYNVRNAMSTMHCRNALSAMQCSRCIVRNGLSQCDTLFVALRHFQKQASQYHFRAKIFL